MRRSIATIAVLLLIISALPLDAFAAEAEDYSENIIYFADDSYIIIKTSIIDTRVINAKTGMRTYVHYSSTGVENWRAVLQGTFSYDGTSATCTASICTVSITDQDWYVVSKTTSKVGDTAYGELTMGQRILGITISKKTLNMSLTCDKNGNLI